MQIYDEKCYYFQPQKQNQTWILEYKYILSEYQRQKKNPLKIPYKFQLFSLNNILIRENTFDKNETIEVQLENDSTYHFCLQPITESEQQLKQLRRSGIRIQITTKYQDEEQKQSREEILLKQNINTSEKIYNRLHAITGMQQGADYRINIVNQQLLSLKRAFVAVTFISCIAYIIMSIWNSYKIKRWLKLMKL